jgi:hypothetical protein
MCGDQCKNKGGVPSGKTYDTFTCSLLVKPTEITFRVAPHGDSYKLATGPLPGRPLGASGSGADCSSPNTFYPRGHLDFTRQVAAYLPACFGCTAKSMQVHLASNASTLGQETIIRE